MQRPRIGTILVAEGEMIEPFSASDSAMRGPMPLMNWTGVSIASTL
jgi:hypothetical protein